MLRFTIQYNTNQYRRERRILIMGVYNIRGERGDRGIGYTGNLFRIICNVQLRELFRDS